MKKISALRIFTFLVFCSLLGTVVFSQELLYPFVTVKALVLRMVVLLTLPFFGYLLMSDKTLRPSWKNPLTIAVVAFFAINFLTIFTGINPSRSWWGNYERMGGVYNLLHLTLLYFYVVTLGKAEGTWLRKLLQTVVWLAAAIALYGDLTAVGLPRIFYDPSFPRISVTTGNPIFLASFLVLPLFLAIFFALDEESKKMRWLYFAAAVAQIIAIIASGTRGALVGIGIGFFVLAPFYFWKSSKKMRMYGLGVCAIVIICVIALLAIKNHLPTGSVLRRVVTFEDSNTQARLIQWKTALRGVKDKPLLGFGPENYYFVANKYFDQNLYKYDASWFDKPHNYLLEILVTTGALGFIGYLAIWFFSIRTSYLGYREGLISWGGFLALSAGMLAYQVQNLFVFDTVPAAITFFVFIGFLGYLAEEYNQDAAEEKPKKSVPSWYSLVFAVLLAGVMYTVYVTDIGTWTVLRDVNYALAIDVQNAQQTKIFFDHAAVQPFVYDRGEIGTKYEAFAVKVAQDMPDKFDSTFINAVLDGAISQLEQTTAAVKNNPIYWFDLGNLYSVKSYYNKKEADPRAEASIQKAIALVPNRIEPYYFLIQIRALQHDIAGAVAVAEELVKKVPVSAEAKWRLALAYKDAHRDDDAVSEAEQAIAQGYRFKLVTEIRWLINYYADKQDYPRVVQLYEQATQLSPQDFQLWASLASAYAKVGDKVKAIAAAEKVRSLSPQSAATVDVFIQGLQ